MGSDNKKIPKRMHSDELIRANELARVIKEEKPGTGEKLKDIPPTPQNYKKFKGENEKPGLPRGIFWGIAGLIIIFVGGFVVSFYIVKEKVKESISSQVGTLRAGVADLENFDPQSASQKFAQLSGSSTPSFGSVVGAFGFLFKGGSDAVAAFGDLAKQLSTLSIEANALETGSDTVANLTAMRGTLGAVDTDSNELSGVLSSIGGASSTLSGAGFYLPLKAQVEGAETFLDSFIPWLASSTPHHVLVLLQNPSEIRPGGGFLGSYADVTVASGTITNISVRDVADVDSAFKANIIPPKPLQLEVTRFRPADANWFFDFPTSASETVHFFEAAATSTSFDGAIAISPKVISGLLSVTGPITISSTSTRPKIASTTFSASNLIVQIQNIVQNGQAAASTGASLQPTYPKAVLGALSKVIFNDLASSTAAERQQLLSLALDWVNKKDVMGYFKDPTFENFIVSYGGSGNVYQLAQNFNGDYLALVDANIRGDKSDLYVAQKVSFDAQINTDGTITDTLKISRTHNGNQSPYWWYQTTSQDYLQVFVPDGSSLTNETGGVKKMITPPINYARSGYSTDPLIATIESSTEAIFIYPTVTTHEEDGKEVFATWAVVSKGKTTSLEFDYTHHAYLPPSADVQYQFVFEKQAGTTRSYDFEIDAPLGYVFAENGLATYEYISDDPPGRLILNLTLEKI